MKLEDLAKGQDCQIRLVGICNFNPETTVLAHVRMAGLCGTGMKPPALIGAWACSACHDAVDRRAHQDMDRDQLRLWHFEGMARTLCRLIALGAVK